MKKQHVMFLDLDGPLFSERALMLPENNEYASITLEQLKLHPLVSYWCADPVAIAMLIELYRFRSYKIVICGNWADPQLHSREQIENLLRRNGLGIAFHKDWTTFSYSGVDKVEQIKSWLDNNHETNYIIVDDIDSEDGLSDIKKLKENNLNKENIVITSFDDGITIKDYYKMKAILANWS
jgi:hypothetical protein